LVKKHRYVSVTNISATTDYYFLLLPTPGIAYWVAALSAGTTPTSAISFTPVQYSDFTSMFGAGPQNTADVVTKFRFVSNHFEMIPTVNQMVWSGSVQAWKIPVAVETRPSAVANNTDMWGITGLNGIVTNLSNQYSGPFIKGLYTACYNANSSFPFTPTMENTASVPGTLNTFYDFGALTTTSFPGFDNSFESMVIKVSGVTANETCIIKTWACVEYQISPNSGLYQFQTLSPHDRLAIDLYKEIILNLPVGVPFDENDNFWNRVLQIIHQISGVGSLLPGPYGQIGRGVNLLSGAAMNLLR
jgi:hypothetical protein